MAQNDSRPVNLSLSPTRFSFPVTAYASIFHRVCAVITWFGLGIVLLVMNSAEGQDPLLALQNTMNGSFFGQFIGWGILAGFGYYCAGSLKHLIQDFGYFEDFAGGQVISWAALGSGVVLAILAGVYVWA